MGKEACFINPDPVSQTFLILRPPNYYPLPVPPSHHHRLRRARWRRGGFVNMGCSSAAQPPRNETLHVIRGPGLAALAGSQSSRKHKTPNKERRGQGGGRSTGNPAGRGWLMVVAEKGVAIAHNHDFTFSEVVTLTIHTY